MRRLILARIAVDACILALIRLVLTRDARCARDLGTVVVGCKLSRQALYACGLSLRTLIFAVMASRACSGSCSRDLASHTVDACIGCGRDCCRPLAGGTICTVLTTRRRLVLACRTICAWAPVGSSVAGIASAPPLCSALRGGV
jgi:hypothetical protein